MRLSTLVLFLCHYFCPPGRLVSFLHPFAQALALFYWVSGLCATLKSQNPVSGTECYR
ncbi:Hypothetical protein RY69_1408 [Bifidobacterium breve]|nr:Hypothetical protein RY69_1408 [Bifidobacterium breve]